MTMLKPQHPQDALAAAPSHHIVLLENDSVRVLDTRLKAGERTPVHTHEWPAALYVISWSDFIRRDGEGNILLDSRAQMTAPTPGAVIWGAALPPHSAENVGTGDLHVIAIELKGQ